MSREIFEEKAISVYNEIYNQFFNLALNRFKWNNLPYGLTSEKMEEMLICYGQVMFYKNENGGFYILPCYEMTDLNVYGIATNYDIMSLNGKVVENKFSYDNGIIIKNNPFSKNDKEMIEKYSKIIDDYNMTQQVNLFQQCMSKVVLCENNSQLSAKSIIKKIMNFEYFIYGKKSLLNNIETSNVLDTTSPFIIDKLQEQMQLKFNECLAKLGINANENVRKKERMTQTEIEANNEYIEKVYELMYNMRLKACKEIKEKFNYDLIVEGKKEGNENE